jgi:importin subunit alpha-1
MVVKRRQASAASAATSNAASTSPSVPSVEMLPTYVTIMQTSHDSAQQLAAVSAIRRLLSIEDGPPIEAVVVSGAVPHLVNLLRRGESNETLQCEAAWALTNVASSTSLHAQSVIDAGALPLLVDLLHSTFETVRDQAVWALGNLASDFRDAVIATGCAPRLAEIATTEVSPKLLSRIAWVMENVCRGTPSVSFASIRCLVEPLGRLLHSTDDETATYAGRALAHAAGATEDLEAASPVQLMLDTAGVADRLVKLMMMRRASGNLKMAALRAVGAIMAAGNGRQTRHMLDAGCLTPIGELLSCANRDLRRQAAWTISQSCVFFDIFEFQ